MPRRAADLAPPRRLESWLADAGIDVVLITGGTGPGPRDRTDEVVRGVLDKELTGFGELFRHLSHRQIGSAAMLSGAVAGLAGRLQRPAVILPPRLMWP